eukprot:3039655-Prymnesium_polylepis.1
MLCPRAACRRCYVTAVCWHGLRLSVSPSYALCALALSVSGCSSLYGTGLVAVHVDVMSYGVCSVLEWTILARKRRASNIIITIFPLLRKSSSRFAGGGANE